METLHYILLAILILYLLAGSVFIYISLSYRKQFKRIRSATNIIFRDLNEVLAKVASEYRQEQITLDYTPFEFASDNDDFIEAHRDQIYTTIEQTRKTADALVKELEEGEVRQQITNQLATIEDNLANYRRLVIKHNKIIDNYNFNARSVVFIVFGAIINMKSEDHI